MDQPHLRRICCLLAILFFTSCCATLQSKVGSKHRDQNDMPPQFGHPYSGVVSSLGGWCYFVSPNMKYPHVFLLIAPLVFVFSVIDLPLTMVADTVFLPFEVGTEAENPRLTLKDECDYSKMDLIGE